MTRTPPLWGRYSVTTTVPIAPGRLVTVALSDAAILTIYGQAQCQVLLTTFFLWAMANWLGKTLIVRLVMPFRFAVSCSLIKLCL